jgi:hypothetical protein
VTGQMPAQIRVTIDVSDAKGKTRRFVAEEAIQSQAIQSTAGASQSAPGASQSSQSGPGASQSGQSASQSGQSARQ